MFQKHQKKKKAVKIDSISREAVSLFAMASGSDLALECPPACHRMQVSIGGFLAGGAPILYAVHSLIPPGEWRNALALRVPFVVLKGALLHITSFNLAKEKRCWVRMLRPEPLNRSTAHECGAAPMGFCVSRLVMSACFYTVDSHHR